MATCVPANIVFMFVVSFVDLDSLLSADDQSQPRLPAEVDPPPSLVSQSASTVFTQLSLNVSVKQVSGLLYLPG